VLRTLLASSSFRLLALTSVAWASLALQAETHLLASGPPPLTSEMGDKMAIFYQWALEVRFTPEQKQEFETYIVRDWADAGKRQSTLKLLEVLNQLVSLPEDKRQQVQATFHQTLLEELRKSTADAESAWLLAIYEHTRVDSGNQRTEAAAPASARSSAPDPRLLGKWRAGSVAATQYYNAYTGAPAPTSGSSFFYEFLPDGTYHMNGLMQMTTYGCTSSIWRDHSGTYRVEGNRLYIQPTQGVVKSRVCGGQEVTKEDKRELAVHTYHFESGSQGENLVLGSVEGNARPDYFRREK
jgi:hypothetical protein